MDHNLFGHHDFAFLFWILSRWSWGDLCPCLDVCFHFCSLNKFGILVYLGKKIILNFLWFYLNSFSVFCVRWVFGISICRKLVTSGVGSSAFHLDK